MILEFSLSPSKSVTDVTDVTDILRLSGFFWVSTGRSEIKIFSNNLKISVTSVTSVTDFRGPKEKSQLPIITDYRSSRRCFRFFWVSTGRSEIKIFSEYLLEDR
jgi:hypothetical protein